MATILDRFKRSWSAFLGRDPTEDTYERLKQVVYSTYHRPDRLRLSRGTTKSIVNTIYNRIAVDCSMIDLRHVLVDENGNFTNEVNSTLNEALSLSSNIDQGSHAFIQDLVMSMFDEGVVAVLPVKTDEDPYIRESYKIYELRTGKIVEWAPDRVLVNAYDEDTGVRKDIWVRKDIAAIIENPFYSIMNEPNSIAQRLIRLLSQIEALNAQSSSGKLDMIIQLPYTIRSPAKQNLAEDRRKMLEEQLENSRYGIGYIDATEKVIQLNRSLENNLWTQATDLTSQLYNQFGLTEKIFNGTASEEEQINYYNTTINPIMAAISQEFTRKFLTQIARTKGQTIKYFRDPFNLVPVKDLAEIADKFTRNEIMSSNEIRAVVGLMPSDDPRANQLINSNLNHSDQELGNTPDVATENQNEEVNSDE